MAIYVAAVFALWALVAAVGGIAAITRGWVLPNIRRSVERTRLYGLGVLLFAAGLFLIAAGEAASSDVMHSAGGAVGVAVMTFSAGVVRASGRPAGVDEQIPDKPLPGAAVGPDGSGDRQ